MTREEYITHRNTVLMYGLAHPPISLAYEYYLEFVPDKTKAIPLQVFEQTFAMYCYAYAPNFEHFYRHFDRQFEVTLVYSNKAPTKAI